MTTAEAARQMKKSEMFIRIGLREGRFPFGYAVKTSTRWSYYISEQKFKEYTGLK